MFCSGIALSSSKAQIEQSPDRPQAIRPSMLGAEASLRAALQSTGPGSTIAGWHSTHMVPGRVVVYATLRIHSLSKTLKVQNGHGRSGPDPVQSAGSGSADRRMGWFLARYGRLAVAMSGRQTHYATRHRQKSWSIPASCPVDLRSGRRR